MLLFSSVNNLRCHLKKLGFKDNCFSWSLKTKTAPTAWKKSKYWKGSTSPKAVFMYHTNFRLTLFFHRYLISVLAYGFFRKKKTFSIFLFRKFKLVEIEVKQNDKFTHKLSRIFPTLIYTPQKGCCCLGIIFGEDVSTKLFAFIIFIVESLCFSAFAASKI